MTICFSFNIMFWNLSHVISEIYSWGYAPNLFWLLNSMPLSEYTSFICSFPVDIFCFNNWICETFLYLSFCVHVWQLSYTNWIRNIHSRLCSLGTYCSSKQLYRLSSLVPFYTAWTHTAIHILKVLPIWWGQWNFTVISICVSPVTVEGSCLCLLDTWVSFISEFQIYTLHWLSSWVAFFILIMGVLDIFSV